MNIIRRILIVSGLVSAIAAGTSASFASASHAHLVNHAQTVVANIKHSDVPQSCAHWSNYGGYTRQNPMLDGEAQLGPCQQVWTENQGQGRSSDTCVQGDTKEYIPSHNLDIHFYDNNAYTATIFCNQQTGPERHRAIWGADVDTGIAAQTEWGEFMHDLKLKLEDPAGCGHDSNGNPIRCNSVDPAVSWPWYHSTYTEYVATLVNGQVQLKKK